MPGRGGRMQGPRRSPCQSSSVLAAHVTGRSRRTRGPVESDPAHADMHATRPVTYSGGQNSHDMALGSMPSVKQRVA
jgi:hypothetical protein